MCLKNICEEFCLLGCSITGESRPLVQRNLLPPCLNSKPSKNRHEAAASQALHLTSCYFVACHTLQSVKMEVIGYDTVYPLYADTKSRDHQQKYTVSQPRVLQSERKPVNLLVSRICCCLKNKKDLSTSSLAFCIPVQGRILMMRCSAMVSTITVSSDYRVEV